jgi:hypothetical protein
MVVINGDMIYTIFAPLLLSVFALVLQKCRLYTVASVGTEARAYRLPSSIHRQRILCKNGILAIVLSGQRVKAAQHISVVCLKPLL